MALVSQYEGFFAAYNPEGGGYEEWNMWCQAFVARCSKAFGTFVRDYATARAARLASGWLNPDPSTAPIGAVGYWLWSSDDHVAIHVGGGIWMMGSRHVTYRFGGVAGNAGLVSYDDFQARAGLTFAGWAGTNGGNVIPIDVPAPAPAGRRTVGSFGSTMRAAATTESASKGDLVPGWWGDFTEYVVGQDPYGNGKNLWLKSGDTYIYLNSMTQYSTAGLTDVTPPPVVVPPVVEPPVVEPPVVEPPVVEPPVVEPPVVVPPVVVPPVVKPDPKPINGGLIAIIAAVVVGIFGTLAAFFGWGS